jgi:CCR4-NOT transcriptional complex subunit CAF120
MKWHRVWAIISTPSASNISYSAAPLVTFHKSSLFANRKSPLLSFHNITQAYGVYPGQPELVMESTLIKVEGRYGDGELAGGMKGKGGWLLIMPDVKKGQVGASVMLTSIMGMF